MENQPGNQTPNTPAINETELREMNVDELRQEAKNAGVGGTSGMKKDQLVEAFIEAKSKANAGDKSSSGQDQAEVSGQDGSEEVGAGPDEGRIRTGPETSKSLKYSPEITSPDDEPEREGRSLATTHHEVIKQWAEARSGRPATVEGTEHDDHLGVLRFDFGDGTAKLREVSWEEWFETFDSRGLNFIYQEQRSDGKQSNFFRLENPQREAA